MDFKETMSILLFPAYAGVIPTGFSGSAGVFTFPRIRGGDPYESCGTPNCRNFSPHTRG